MFPRHVKMLTIYNCMILGDQDESVPAAVYPALQALKPDASLYIIEGAQHMAFWTHQEKFNQILAKVMA